MEIKEEDITLVVYVDSNGVLNGNIKFTQHGVNCINSAVELTSAATVEEALEKIIMDEAERANKTNSDGYFNGIINPENKMEKVAAFAIAAIVKYVNGTLSIRVIN